MVRYVEFVALVEEVENFYELNIGKKELNLAIVGEIETAGMIERIGIVTVLVGERQYCCC